MSRTVGSSIVTKCTRIIDILVEARQPLAFSDIVAETGYVKSSAHRILSVLLNENLAHYDSDARTYSVGSRVQSWARSSWQRTDLQKVAADELEKLCDSTNLNIALSILDNNSILYIRTFDGFYMRFAARPGDHAPLHCTAAGKVFLAFMSESRCSEFMGTSSLERYTENTIVDSKILVKDIAEVRDRGYGYSEKEEIAQVRGIAAPIWSADKKVVACVSIWSVAERSSRQDMQNLAPKLLSVANKISKRLV